MKDTKTQFVHETKELESQPKGKNCDFLDGFQFTTLKPIFVAFSFGTVQRMGPLLAVWLLPQLMLPAKGQIVFTQFL